MSTMPSRLQVSAESYSRGIKPGEPLPEDYAEKDPYSLMAPRRAGILLHPTSLPGPHGIGDLGPDAFKFIDWLDDAECCMWQVLPLVPPGRKNGEDGYPYAGQDANCGNTLLLSLDFLLRDGLLQRKDLPPQEPVRKIDFDQVAATKDPVVEKAARNLLAKGGPLAVEYQEFKSNPAISGWLGDAALFAALDREHGTQFWWQWPEDVRFRNEEALQAARERHQEEMEVFKASQFLFQKQWLAVRNYANGKGIKIVGDMPIYVGTHSSDVWAHQSQFMLDSTGAPSFVSGVPPDMFSATGQLWGSALYNWPAMEVDKFKWWASRMRRAAELYDEFRIDHFRGFAGFWSIPASEETAIKGRWLMGPGVKFFAEMKKAVTKEVDIIAEDLGVITPDVVELRRQIGAAGMSILQFAFSGDSSNLHLLHNHEVNQFVFTGTHDNETVLGWWRNASEEEKQKARQYLHFREKKDDEVPWIFIEAVLSSAARNCVVTMQDIMKLDNSSRMNNPAEKTGNWGWRLGESAMLDALGPKKKQLRQLINDFNRTSRKPEVKESKKVGELVAAESG